MSGTATRFAAAMVGLAVVVPAIVWGGVPAVATVMGLGGLIALDEYARMAFPDDVPFARAWLVVAGALVAWSAHGVPDAAPVGLATAAVATLVMVTLRPGPDLSAAADRLGRFLIGLVWVPGLLPFVVRLRSWEAGAAWVVVALAVAWLGDTGAYFAGRRFGSRPLYPLVSPKKTWEGLAGGVVAVVAGLFVARWLWLPELSVLDCVVLGVVGCLAGVIGDLSESLLKRAWGVKDSGWILPGHGGILDRIDSVLFTAPVVYVYATLFVYG